MTSRRPPLPVGDELRALLAAPRDGIVKLLVQRLGGGRHATPPEVHLTRAGGLVGDRWASVRTARRRQLTVMDWRVVSLLLAHTGGADADRPGDNLVVDWATSVAAMPAGLRFAVGTARFEVNDLPHMGCAKFEARFGRAALDWVNDPAHADLRLRGVNASVDQDGVVALGDALAPAGYAPANLELFGRDDDDEDREAAR